MIRIKPKVAAIKGNTPALRKMTQAIITPVLEDLSEITTKIPAVIRTKKQMMLDTSPKEDLGKALTNGEESQDNPRHARSLVPITCKIKCSDRSVSYTHLTLPTICSV